MSSFAVAQKTQQQVDEFSSPLTAESKKVNKKRTTQEAKGVATVFWSEDFSNGFDGQGSNGEWTTDGDQGDLWFQTFPVGAVDGYDPAAAIGGAYDERIPNFFGTRDVCESPTRDNGVMMIDADRWNSTSTESEPDGTLTQNPLFSEFISPVMDLSAISNFDNNAKLVFYQYARGCCSGYSLSVSFSFDGGDTYGAIFDVFNPYGGGNDEIDIRVDLCLNEALAGVEDLSNMRMKFVWDGAQSHYFWSIDDISIESIPLNDAVILDSFYDRHATTFDDPDASYTDYYQTMEYQNTPNYTLKPITIGAVVGNPCSANEQTGVKLIATVENPDGSEQEIETDEITLPVGAQDTIYAEPTFLDAFGTVNDTGQYIITYEIVQNEDDELPDNSIGEDRGFVVSSDITEEEPYAVMMNGGVTYDGAFNQDQFASDALVCGPVVFDQTQSDNAVITHVEAVFLNSADFAETQPGEIVFFNVRQGAVGDEDETDPSTITTVLFDSEFPLEYDDEELLHEITEADLWDPADGFPQNWVSFELPNPIMIEPGVVYNPEIRIPPTGGPAVFLPVSSVNAEEQTIWLYNFMGDNPGWGTSAGPATPSLRFRTADVSTVSQVTHESGVQLLQNWPNPFNDVTRIQYRLDETADVTFEVFDISGRLVHSEDHGRIPAGVAQTFEFSAKSLNAGVYTYSIVSNGERVTRKLTIE